METLYVWLAIGGAIAGLYLISWIVGKLGAALNSLRTAQRKAKLYDEQQAELSQLHIYRAELDGYRDKLDERERDISSVIGEKSQGFPWLAKAFADYFELQSLKQANYLQYKKHPARVAAETVREIAKERRRVEAELRVAKYLLQYYENLFPWLVDFRGEDLDDLIERKLHGTEQAEDPQTYDPARTWLTEAEYKSLPSAQKYQLALDRYWKKRKSPWEIGRDYERYIGYLHEKDGSSVYYQGIVEGLADMGRDLIATKGRYVEVVQCKNWSQAKTIHEKHICQLLGTVTAYKVDHPEAEAKGKFVTSTKLSDRAKRFADILGIEYMENFPLQPYPSIKCNVSRRDGTRIYHLPFDQQYDRTLIEEERSEAYVVTVQEAESLGFRRAFRWKGPQAE